MRSLLTLLVLLAFALPGLAQDWISTTKVLIIPGRAAGAIELGKPVPGNVAAMYGDPAVYTEPSPGPDGKDTGSVVYGKTADFELTRGLLVKLNDGRGDQNVYVVYVRGLRAYTAEGLTMGTSMARAKAVYPTAVAGTSEMTGDPTLRIPGLEMLFSGGQLVEMVVRPK